MKKGIWANEYTGEAPQVSCQVLLMTQVATLSLGRREDPSVMKSLQSVTRQDGGDNFPNTHPAEKQSTKFYILERDELKLLWSALRI